VLVEKLSVSLYVFVPDRELDFLTASHVKLDTDCRDTDCKYTDCINTDCIDTNCINTDYINAIFFVHANCMYTGYIIPICTVPIHMI
jgi:hypothetical protein